MSKVKKSEAVRKLNSLHSRQKKGELYNHNHITSPTHISIHNLYPTEFGDRDKKKQLLEIQGGFN